MKRKRWTKAVSKNKKEPLEKEPEESHNINAIREDLLSNVAQRKNKRGIKTYWRKRHSRGKFLKRINEIEKGW